MHKIVFVNAIVNKFRFILKTKIEPIIAKNFV